MTIDEAEKILLEKNIPLDLYSFSEENKSEECIVLEKRERDWVIYIWEHGHEVTPEFYSSENAAATAFVDRVIRLAQ